MFTAALCWAGGFVVSALGVYPHMLWLIYLGYGVIGGIGLGIGYISPVSTLIRWFPDRPGMATGMAIMGFGGGAFIASPLSVWLMGQFSTPTHVGVAETFIVHGADLSLLHDGRRRHRARPAAGLEARRLGRPGTAKPLITTQNVYVYEALKTPQFWLIWWVLCLNVTAGIGVLGQASAMSQEMFQGQITAVAASGLVGLFSLFNMAGRFFWSSTSDYIGRKNTYFIFFALGTVLYALVPYTGVDRQRDAVRAMLRSDLQHVWRRVCDRTGLSARYVRHPLCRRDPWHAADGVVDGRHLRSGVGELHPRSTMSTHGVAGRRRPITSTMYVMAGLAGDRLYLQRADPRRAPAPLYRGDRAAAGQRHGDDGSPLMTDRTAQHAASGNGVKLVLAWGFVGIPLIWGVVQTLVNAIKAFH